MCTPPWEIHIPNYITGDNGGNNLSEFSGVTQANEKEWAMLCSNPLVTWSKVAWKLKHPGCLGPESFARGESGTEGTTSFSMEEGQRFRIAFDASKKRWTRGLTHVETSSNLVVLCCCAIFAIIAISISYRKWTWLEASSPFQENITCVIRWVMLKYVSC